MKRGIRGLLTVLLCCVLSGCGGDKLPPNTSREAYDLGVKALEISDKYLSTDLDKAETIEKLSLLESQIEKNDETYGDAIIKLSIDLLITEIKKPVENTNSDVKEQRDSLAETLNNK